jgi:hypothetical protein
MRYELHMVLPTGLLVTLTKTEELAVQKLKKWVHMSTPFSKYPVLTSHCIFLPKNISAEEGQLSEDRHEERVRSK